MSELLVAVKPTDEKSQASTKPQTSALITWFTGDWRWSRVKRKTFNKQDNVQASS